MSGLRKNEDGQAVVEFAIIAPILLLILCGIIDFAWIFSSKLALDNCAREGARYASVQTDYSNAESVTEEKIRSVAPGRIKDNLTVEIIYSDMTEPGTGDVTVVVKSRINALTFVADTIFNSGTVNLTSSVTMKAG